MLKLGIVGDGNDGIAPLTGCPVPVPTSKPDQYTPVTLLLLQHRPLGHPSSLHPTEPLTQRERESRPSPLSASSTDSRRYIYAVYTCACNWRDLADCLRNRPRMDPAHFWDIDFGGEINASKATGWQISVLSREVYYFVIKDWDIFSRKVARLIDELSN